MGSTRVIQLEGEFMMKIARTLAIAMLASVVTTNVMADDIRLGEAGYGGTGCPAGSASVTLSPDSKSLSLIFDQFVLEAGRSVGKTIDRKNCSIAIPVHVPQGLSVSLIAVDYRGFNSLPRQASAQFSAEYFFAGQQGPRFSRTFLGPIDDEYLINNNLGVQAVVWSACGADVNLRVNASMMLRTNSRREDALSTVDSADFSAGIIYQLQWKRCGQSSPYDFYL
jgi:hypothetical protein